MQQVTNQQKLKPWMGFVLFAVVMVLFLFAGARMQTAWRIYGLIATEAMFLVIAILYAVIFRIPLKEMFPVKKFKVRDFFGSLFLAGGGVLIGFVSIAIVGILIPSSLGAGDVQAISEFNSGSSGYLLTIFAMAVTPAICEEAIQRGAIIANFRTIKKDWIIVLIIGVMFGILHTDTVRFINTALMGGCLAYLMVKRNNFLLPALYHFINNFLLIGMSTITSMLAQQQEQTVTAAEATSAAVDSIPSLMLLATLSPLFLVLGVHLIKRQTEISEGIEKKGMKLGAKIGISIIPCVLLLAGGIALLIL